MSNYMTEFSPNNDTNVYQVKDIEAAPITLLKDTVGWTGKNLLPYPYGITSYSANGVTFTVNDDGSVTVNGTATADTPLRLFTGALQNGNYIISRGFTNVLAGIRVEGWSGSTWVKTIVGASSFSSDEPTFTIDNDGYNTVRIDILIKSGAVLNNQKFYPMLRDASILDSTYEPYHPSVKQTLRDAEVIEGKNLNATKYLLKTKNGVTVTPSNDGSVKVTGTATAQADFTGDNDEGFGGLISFIAPFTADVIFSGSNNNNVLLIAWDNTDNARPYIDSTKTSRQTNNQGASYKELPFYMEEGHKYSINIRVLNGVTANDTLYPMIRLASETNPTFEPYYIPLKDSKFDRAEQRVLGAKNILAYPYRDTTKTSNVINFVDNKNGTITIQAGTATGGDASFVLHNQGGTFKFAEFIGKKCIFSGGLSSSVKIAFWVQGTLNITAQGEEIEFTMPDIGSKEWNMTLYVTQNTVISADTVIKPMIRLASDPDDTYVPYAMTNRELTEAQSFGYKVEAINGMTGGTTTYDSQIKIPKGTYTIIANVFVSIGGALVFKINETDVVIDRNVPNSNFCEGSRAITFDGNTNLTMRCSADTSAKLEYAYLTFIKLKDFQTLT